MRTRDQQRAQKAYGLTVALKDTSDAAKYGSFVLSMPILLRSAGLLGALQFAQQKQKRLVDHVAEHLVEAGLLKQGQDLHERVRTAHLAEYMRLTREVQAILTWHKRFAQSVLKAEPGEEPRS